MPEAGLELLLAIRRLELARTPQPADDAARASFRRKARVLVLELELRDDGAGDAADVALADAAWGVEVLLPSWDPRGALQLRACPFGVGRRVGARLWPSASLIVAWARRRWGADPPPERRPQRILELGAGTGAAGLAVAAHLPRCSSCRAAPGGRGETPVSGDDGCCHEVVLSDNDPRVLRLLRQNVAGFELRRSRLQRARSTGCRCCRTSCKTLDASSVEEAKRFVEEGGGRFDVVIASDLVYEHRMLPLVLDALLVLLRSSGEGESVALLALELRPCGADLRRALPEEARARGLVAEDATDEVLELLPPPPPPGLAVPPLESRQQRLYVVRRAVDCGRP